ncbi:MAG: ExbD/TolR family protein [Phycisphaeraceae bacterium]
MADRPDSPNAPKSTGKPETPVPGSDIDLSGEQVPHHVSTRKKRKKGVGGEDMQLQMTSMIDVVFLLLIYFVITANFTIDEGTLLATMPGNSAQDRPEDTLDPPTNIELTSADDGVTYRIRVDGQEPANASALATYMTNRVASGQMAKDDIVQIKPQGVVRWQHVVNVFNACVSAELENVGFAP